MIYVGIEKVKLFMLTEFDEKFDNGEDITPYLDMSTICRPGYEQRRVNGQLPTLP